CTQAPASNREPHRGSAACPVERYRLGSGRMDRASRALKKRAFAPNPPVGAGTTSSGRVTTVDRTAKMAVPPWKGQPITINAANRAIARNLSSIGTAKFTPHDLRRTAASGMAQLGISRLVIAKVLNHTETSVTAIYDRYGYDSEKRKALDLWGQKVLD